MRLNHIKIITEFFEKHSISFSDGFYALENTKGVDYEKQWKLFLKEKGFKDMKDFEENA